MSCGRKYNLQPWERDDIVEKLEERGDYREAQALRRGDCIDSRLQQHNIEDAANDLDMPRPQYRDCECEREDY